MAARATAALVVSIEIGTDSLPARSFEHAQHPAQFVGQAGRLGVGARAFAADVDQVGPGRGHFQARSAAARGSR